MTFYSKLILIVITIFFFSCKKNETEVDVKEVKSKNDNSQNINLSILIDLSDRISPEKYPNPTMEYYQRDLGYIKSISEAFSEHIKGKRIRQINDKIQVFFNPEPLNPDINNISKKLKIELNKDNVSNELINTINSVYVNESIKIYDLAIKDNNYIGSDIWKFFENNINDYCIDNNHRNVLIILTDGYMFYEDTKFLEDNKSSYLTPELIRRNRLDGKDWNQKIEAGKFGFIKANDDLSNLEVLVLGINPSPNNSYEEKVIKAYWNKWFSEMKVKSFDTKNADLPSNMDKVIKEFIVINRD